LKRRSVGLTQQALRDIAAIGDYIAKHSGDDRARAYVDRIERYCEGLDLAPERGDRRDHIRPGLRAVGFERSATILFVVRPDQVVVLRVRARGVNWTAKRPL